MDKEYNELDSFVIYMTLEGSFDIKTENGEETARIGETVLIPASIESVQLKPRTEKVKILEVYIK
jgi:mannose-6-phosphate isomerase